MAKGQGVWFVEPLDANTNQIIASALSEEVVGVSSGEKICLDGERHNLWECPSFTFVKQLFLDQGKFQLKFTVYMQRPKQLPQNIHNFAKNFLVFRRKNNLKTPNK